jgi:protein-S-isoprenylcysteine O-methyltransferase Ste14
MQRFLRFLLISLSVLLIYFLVLPWIALQLDHRIRFVWQLPFWIEPVAIILILVGISLCLRYCWIQILQTDTLSQPSQSSARTIRQSLSHRLYNAPIFGLWLCGIGLASLLRSPCMIGFAGLIMIVEIVLVRCPEAPTPMTRYSQILHHIKCTPRWVILPLIIVATAIGLPDLKVETQLPPSGTEPGILVQIRCKPGTASLWETDFNQHIRPAIEDVIARGNTYTGIQLIKATLPAQPFDFMLIYTGKTYAGLDKPVNPPQYVALFQREGSLRALSVLKEMLSYEDQVTVTLVYLEKKR